MHIGKEQGGDINTFTAFPEMVPTLSNIIDSIEFFVSPPLLRKSQKRSRPGA
jgi:hypothetical protein